MTHTRHFVGSTETTESLNNTKPATVIKCNGYEKHLSECTKGITDYNTNVKRITCREKCERLANNNVLQSLLLFLSLGHLCKGKGYQPCMAALIVYRNTCIYIF